MPQFPKKYYFRFAKNDPYESNMSTIVCNFYVPAFHE